MAFTFVHAADLHLDSPFKGLSTASIEVGNILKDAVHRAFDNLVDLCIEQGARFLVLSGDLFDWGDKSLRAQLVLRDGLSRLSENEIETFIVWGNHDPLSSTTFPFSWPKGVYIYGANKVATRFVEADYPTPVAISGISHERAGERRNLVSLFEPLRQKIFRIGIVHANLGSDTGHLPYAPCTLDDLIGLDVDYWALGHVHTRAIRHSRPFVVYPGNIQALSIRETGPRGCYVVKVQDDGTINLEFKELDIVRFALCKIDISELGDLDALEQALLQSVTELRKHAGGRMLIVRINLFGNGYLYSKLQDRQDLDALLERQRDIFSDASPIVWIKDIVSSFAPPIDLEERARAQDLLGKILRLSEGLAKDERSLNQILDQALNPLFRNVRAREVLDEPDKEEILDMLKGAQKLLVRLFEG